MRKYLVLILLSIFLSSCATTQTISLTKYSTYQLQDMLNDVEARIQAYQYEQMQPQVQQIQQTTNVYVGKRSAFAEGIEQGRKTASNPFVELLTAINKKSKRRRIKDLFYQRVSILDELERRK
jgi:hypothetical protein